MSVQDACQNEEKRTDLWVYQSVKFTSILETSEMQMNQHF